ncbi:hypothetical protein ES703_46271 [subsurface metagenome]
MTTSKKSKEEILAQMDADAKLAKKEFDEMGDGGELDEGTMTSLSGWWNRWYGKAGHKRLAYILMGKAE